MRDTPGKTPGAKRQAVQKFDAANEARWLADDVAIEEPLEIRVTMIRDDGRPESHAISVTMRTPGDDAALAMGFVFTEGIVRHATDVTGVAIDDAAIGGYRATVNLAAGVRVDLAKLHRHFYVSSSCGVCGKGSLEAVRVVGCPYLPQHRPLLSPEIIHTLTRTLGESQAIFSRTGGLHAAAIFTATGDLIGLREDVGRHNAVDKIIGERILAGEWPLTDRVLVVSGRAGFEIVQKAVMAGVPVVAAVGAPSSLAVDLARDAGQTLIGFARDGRFNVYAGHGRIAGGEKKFRG